MHAIKSLLVVWKNTKDNLYYHVGTLNYDGQKYTFEYTFKSNSPRTVTEAIRRGYRLHPAFPLLQKTYQSEELFPAFDRRIPDNTRIGFENILDEFGLPATADRMDILRETRGMLSQDPYSFEEPLRLNGEELRSNFYVNGIRHQGHISENWYDYVREGDSLIPELEEDNKFDSYAVKVMTSSGVHIGYIPGIYAQAVHSLLKQRISVELTVQQLCPQFASQWWVRVRLEATIELENTDERYRHNLEGFIFQESA